LALGGWLSRHLVKISLENYDITWRLFSEQQGTQTSWSQTLLARKENSKQYLVSSTKREKVKHNV